MPIRATKRGDQRTRLDLDADVLVCGASFAGLTVARELAGRGRVLMIDRYEVGERQTSACAAPTEWLEHLGLAPSIQQTFDYDVQESVFAFEKVQGLDRTGVVDAAFWSKLADPIVPKPRYASAGDHIEVDKTRQVLFIVRGGAVRLISPVSTAGIPGYFTPVGTFAIFRKVDGYDTSPLGILYKPMYFTGGYAIHGNPSVPPYPASHGCVRVPNFVIERLFTSEPYGETVIVY